MNIATSLNALSTSPDIALQGQTLPLWQVRSVVCVRLTLPRAGLVACRVYVCVVCVPPLFPLL